jgi:hypothetical protein
MKQGRRGLEVGDSIEGDPSPQRPTVRRATGQERSPVGLGGLVRFLLLEVDDRGALMQHAIEIVPQEVQTDDVVPALDDVLVIVDRQQIAPAERQDRLEHVPIFGAEAKAAAIGQLAPLAKMELANLVGSEFLATVQSHVQQRSQPRQQQQPAQDGRHAKIKLGLQARQISKQRPQHGDLIDVL